MTHKEIAEQSRKQLLQAGIKLFGSKGYEATSVVDIEKNLKQTRGAIIYHFKSKLGFFEATVNKYYLGRIMPASVPEECRNSLKEFYTNFVSMLEEECMELMNSGVRNVAGTFINLETDALRSIPNFRQKCKEFNDRQILVFELVIGRAIHNGELKSGIVPSVIAEMFMNVVTGQTYRANCEGYTYYTDGMLRQFNSLYRLITNQQNND